MGMQKTLGELSELTGAELRGPHAGQVVITTIGALDEAGPGAISFLANRKYRKQLEQTRASAVVIPRDVAWDKPCLVSDNPYLVFVKITEIFAPAIPLPGPGVHALACVHPEARLEPDVAIGPFCVVEAGARIGAGTVLVAQVYVGANTALGAAGVIYPNVVIREGITLGNRVIVHPGAVIGADGFGFAPDGKQYKKIPQIGTVRIEDDVEIGANVTIDRAALGTTSIGRGSKIDNLVMVAHNCRIGEDTVVAAQAGFSGTTTLGNHVMVGGQVGTNGHITIGDNAILGAQSGIMNNVKAGEFFWGTPARPHKETLRLLAEYGRLREMRKQIKELEGQVKRLEKK